MKETPQCNEENAKETQLLMAAGGSSSLWEVPVVVDHGSGAVKAGFAGEEQPRAVCAMAVGRLKHARVMVGGVLGAREE